MVIIVVHWALSFQEAHTLQGHHTNWIQSQLLDLGDVAFLSESASLV